MPKKVIKLKKEEDGLSLHQERTRFEILEQYTALSYCWGGDQLVKTTTKNLQDYTNGMHIQTLPAGIRDAITATNAPGTCPR